MNKKLQDFLHLMRFHKPVGIFLLWFPTAWALWLANIGHVSLKLIGYFMLGTLVTRSAGCVINDIADRKIDPHVTRTKNRPLARQDIKVKEAIILLLLLCLIAGIIVIQLPIACFKLSLIALLLLLSYPFFKRFFQAPQLILGLAFSMGIPMAYIASGTIENTNMLVLFIINFCWIIAYDTIYAMVDKEDDLKINVHSTAIFFGDWDKIIILFLHCLCQILWIYLAIKLHYSTVFYIGWFAATMILIYQNFLIQDCNPIKCFKAFSTNIWYGLIMWGAVAFSMY